MRSILVRSAAAALFIAAASFSVQAQATRTWVSGVGDDVNPCSRTAPCKTFAGAISKTAAGGEINALDSGGFGTVTITKSITIDGHSANASSLASATTGIIINDSATATPGTIVVTLRNLQINGAPPTTPGQRGIRFISGKTLHVENVNIFGFRGAPGRGIDITLAGAVTADIFIRNTTITNCSAGGVVVFPTSGTPTARVNIEDSTFNQNASGVFAGTGAVYNIRSTTMRGNTAAGIDASAGSVNCVDCAIDSNSIGVQTAGAAVVRLGHSSITQSTTVAISGVGVSSWGDNYFAGNTGGDAPVMTPLTKR